MFHERGAVRSRAGVHTHSLTTLRQSEYQSECPSNHTTFIQTQCKNKEMKIPPPHPHSKKKRKKETKKNWHTPVQAFHDTFHNTAERHSIFSSLLTRALLCSPPLPCFSSPCASAPACGTIVKTNNNKMERKKEGKPAKTGTPAQAFHDPFHDTKHHSVFFLSPFRLVLSSPSLLLFSMRELVEPL